MAYYKCVLNGHCEGQSVVNVLWYRAVESPLGALLDPTSGEDISFQIAQEVWPAMKPVMHESYVLDNVTVYPYDSSLIPAFSIPYVRAVVDNGGTTGDTNGPATCAILHFNVESVPLVNLIYPKESSLLAPRRGYLAIGPIKDSWITNQGLIGGTGGPLALLQTLGDKLAETLENLDPVAFFVPLRARSRNILGVLTLQGFAPVSSVEAKTRASFRRSRLPEAS